VDVEVARYPSRSVDNAFDAALDDDCAALFDVDVFFVKRVFGASPCKYMIAARRNRCLASTVSRVNAIDA
jgi:hypothetical protein